MGVAHLCDILYSRISLYGFKSKMSNPKLMVLGTEQDFTKEEVKMLTDLITKKLTAAGIASSSFAFQIRVEYKPKETT